MNMLCWWPFMGLTRLILRIPPNTQWWVHAFVQYSRLSITFIEDAGRWTLGAFCIHFYRKTCVCLTEFSKSILLSNLKSPPLCTADSIIPKSKMKPSNLKLELLKFDRKILLELIIDPTLSASPLVRCNQETLPMTRWICDSGDVGDVGSSLSADNFNKRRARQSRNLVDAGTADGRNGRETSRFLELRSLESPRNAWVWMYISEHSHD